MPQPTITILWPDEENYAQFREVSDGIKSPTLEGYRAAISNDLESKERAGIKIEKISFKVDDLIAFARSRGLNRVDSQTRAQFAMVPKLQNRCIAED